MEDTKKKEHRDVNEKMSSDGNIYELRSKMSTHKYSETRVTKEFLNGLEIFMF